MMAVAGPRGVVYLLAVNSGLRRAELEQLVKGDVHLYVEEPFIKARSSTTKNHKDGVVWLNDEVTRELKRLVGPDENAAERLFGSIPSIEEFREDLEVAGIPYKDEQERIADFHALRHTFCTNLARVGVPPRRAMEMMRHSDMRLTNKTYTDPLLLPIRDAVKLLPTFCGGKPDAPGGAPKLVKWSPPVSPLPFHRFL